jgi:thiol peroxidase
MARSTTLKGNPLALEGPELKVGDPAPDATLRADLVTDTTLGAYAGKVRIYSVVPSLDTPICALQTKRFNDEASSLPNVEFITISCDLPVAQSRFCDAENIGDRVTVLSDHKLAEFGQRYGTLITDLRVLSRALFVVGADDTLKHVEYVPEVAEHPDYDAALAVLKAQ